MVMLERAPTFPSIIETMTADFYETLTQGRSDMVAWIAFHPDQKKTFVDAMAVSVSRLPDHCELPSVIGFRRVDVTEGRQFVLAEHLERRR